LARPHARRKLDLVEGSERKVPLDYNWVPDQLLNELVVEMCKGDDATRKTPPWCSASTAMRVGTWPNSSGLDLLPGRSKTHLHDEVNALDWTQGVGRSSNRCCTAASGSPCRAVAEVSAGRRKLFAQKLLAVCVCTERWRPASTYRRVRSC